MLYRVREGTLLLPGREEERGRLVLTFWCLMSERMDVIGMVTAKRQDRQGGPKLNNRADVSNVKMSVKRRKKEVEYQKRKEKRG